MAKAQLKARFWKTEEQRQIHNIIHLANKASIMIICNLSFLSLPFKNENELIAEWGLCLYKGGHCFI